METEDEKRQKRREKLKKGYGLDLSSNTQERITNEKPVLWICPKCQSERHNLSICYECNNTGLCFAVQDRVKAEIKSKYIAAIAGGLGIGLLLLMVIGAPVAAVMMSSTSPVQDEVTDKASDEPTKEIEQAVKDYFSRPRNSTPQMRDLTPITFPPMKVYGVTFQRENNDLYIVGADVESPTGDRKIEQVICRKFYGDGKSYWKAQEHNIRLLETLRGDKYE